MSTRVRPERRADVAPEDEARLIERARAGDREALDRLAARYVDDVYAVAMRILGDRELAQDAAQDAFVNAMNGLARFRGDASFRTWLLRITVNAARTQGRRRGRRREMGIPEAVELESSATDPASRAVIRTEAERAFAALARLPEKQRLAVSLRVEQGLSYQEIGALIDCSEGAARVNYHLGIKRLRELVK